MPALYPRETQSLEGQAGGYASNSLCQRSLRNVMLLQGMADLIDYAVTIVKVVHPLLNV
jgi:hypothetical protein